ncbi:anhydro-N-acetylmuramic acid kinase [Hypoxylon argillaceum]|nr:anhydro-N-acetylmuramic acid kinase [Hypoxylon argillaceum]
MPYIIGLNSGSSFDGVDAVLCSIDIGADSHPTPPKYIDALTIDWPDDLRSSVVRAFENELTIFELTRLNYAAGALYAEAVNTLLAKNNLTHEDIDVVGYDGQTIYQEPPDRPKIASLGEAASLPLTDLWTKGGYPCGLFIVESGVVAARTNITTVTQFRPIDHALCGSGAPLMQYLDFVAFRGLGRPVVTLNIGGIANLQLADSDRSRMMAFDTGPGNVMIDHAMRRREGKEYDKDGETAAKGQVIEPLLEELLGHDFFERKPPRSAWRLDFGSAYADDILQRYTSASTEDLVATFTMFTARSIENALTSFVLPKAAGLQELVASGGGTRNATLMKWLGERIATHGIKLALSDAYNMPAAYKEAIKFATLAFAAKRGLANNIPAASGASGFAVLGKLTLAPYLAKGI